MAKMNPTAEEADVQNVGDDNDVNELKNESPGQAAKRARLRQSMQKIKSRPAPADETKALPRNRANASGSIEKIIGGTLSPVAALAGKLMPGVAGAQEPEIGGEPAAASPISGTVPDPMADIRAVGRNAQASGDSATLRRLLAHLASMRGNR
jgi:hypothetical protein